MKPTNRFVDYDLTDNFKMSEIIEDCFAIFDEASTKLKQANEKKLKVVKDTTRPNDIYINPSIKVEFLKTMNDELPIHLIFNKYEQWFEELYRLTTVNGPWLQHPAIFQHMKEILAICATIQAVIDYAKIGLPEE